MTVDSRCRITLLGPITVRQAELTHTHFGSQKAAALLAYLALRPGPHPRETVIELFWPEMDLPQGRNNLSTLLSGLRRQLEPAGVAKGSVLPATHVQIGLNPEAVSTDVADFERLCTAADREDDPARRAAQLSQATALYRGEFQPGNYQDWAVRESERLQARMVSALDRLAADSETLKRFQEAADAARRRVQIDPYAEEGHLTLIRCLLRAGQSGASRAAAQSLREFMRAEFGSELSPEIQRTLDALLGPDQATHTTARLSRQTSKSGSPAQEVVVTAEKPSAPEPSLATPPVVPAAPIPFWLTRFFGREGEISRLAGLLLPPKDAWVETLAPRNPCRLVTLTGAGGAGKTRLAAEFARQVATSLQGWCGFVSLTELTDPAQIPGQIAQSLRLPPAPSTAPMEQIAAFFRERDGLNAPPALLVLDNLEQLLSTQDDSSRPSPVVEIIRALLDNAPRLSVLCTSRRPLQMQGEQVVPLGPLAVPELPRSDIGDTTTPDTLAGIVSIRLYLDRARAVRPEFGLTEVNAPAVAALCRALEGSPLALELAASWVRLLPPRAMSERISQGLGMPEGRREDLPARHRSLSAALDWSWRLLTPAQQRVIAQLSVFRGGWDLASARAVCEEPDILTLLADLTDASLVQAIETRDGEMRYRLMETVREFSRQKFDDPSEWVALEQRHTEYFEALALEAGTMLRGPAQMRCHSLLEVDHDNIRAVLDRVARSVTPEQAEVGLRMIAALAPFWRARSHHQEGHDRSVAILAAASRPTAVRVDALNRTGELTTLLAAYAEAKVFHSEALTLSQEIGYVPGEADALLGIGTNHYWHKDFIQAEPLFRDSLTLRQECSTAWGDSAHRLWGEAAIYHNLGNLALRRSDYAESVTLFEQALALRRQQGDPPNIAGTLGSLGQVALLRGDYAAAERDTVETMLIFDSIGQRWTIALCLIILSHIAEAQGHAERAVRLLAASLAVRETYHFPLPPVEQPEMDGRKIAFRSQLGATIFEAAWAEGSHLTWEQTITLAQAG